QQPILPVRADPDLRRGGAQHPPAGGRLRTKGGLLMRLRGSRYENVKSFAPGDDGSVAFPGLRPRDIGPAIGVLEHSVAGGRRVGLSRAADTSTAETRT